MFWKRKAIKVEDIVPVDMSMVIDFEEEKLKKMISSGLSIYEDASQFILYLLLNAIDEEHTQAILSLIVQNTSIQLEELKKDNPND